MKHGFYTLTVTYQLAHFKCCLVKSYNHYHNILYTRAVQWETGKVLSKIACMTSVIVCRVCEGGDLELPIDGVGMPAARIGTWETDKMVGPLQQCTKQEQRSVVRFLFSEGVKPIEINRWMRIQYGDRCMSCTQVYEWTEKFKNCVTSVEDSPRPGPALTAVTEDNIAAVENVIRENRRVTIEVASLLEISVGSAHHIIHDELKF